MQRNMLFAERLGASLRACGYWNAQRQGLEIGRFCVENGYLPSYVYRWLRGEVPRAEALLLLARHLKADPAWLVGLDPTPAGDQPARGRRRPLPIAGGSGAIASAPADPGPLAVGPDAPRASDKSHSLSRFLRFLQHWHRGWGVGTPATPLAYGH